MLDVILCSQIFLFRICVCDNNLDFTTKYPPKMFYLQLHGFTAAQIAECMYVKLHGILIFSLIEND